MSTIESAVHGDEHLAAARAKAPQRRNREELEQLAADFVNSKIHVKTGAPSLRVSAPMLAGVGVVAAALLAWAVWPEAGTETVRETTAQAAEAEAWARRLEAERERKRRELQSSREYLAKMAASDSALLAEMTSRAQALASRAAEPSPVAMRAGDPAPAGAEARVAEPTPRTETKGGGAPVTAEPARVESARPAQVAAAAPGSPQPQAAATTAPVQVAQARAADCRIHVSELSASGKLTYADVARMKGAVTDERGHVFTPPVPVSGRTMTFEVMPNGCVRVARTR